MSELMKAISQEKTMSSREIAELVESRHDAVKKSIDRLVERGVITSPPLANFKNINNVDGTEYLICKRDSYIIVAQLSPEFTAKLVDRWQELEGAASNVHYLIPKTLPEALRLAADLAEKNEALVLQIEADAPKVNFHDKVTNSINCQTVQEVAKLLNTGQNKLFTWMRDHKMLMPGNLPYQEFIDRGHLKVTQGQYTDKRGESHTYTRTLITGKGFAFIQRRFEAIAA